MTDPDSEAGLSWKLYAKVGLAFAVALVLLYPLPGVIQDPGTDHFWLGVAGLVFGGFAFYGGWERYKRVQLVRDTPTSKAQSLAVGLAEVKGEATPVDEPLVSPLTNQAACMYTLRVEEHHPDDDGSDWETVLRLSDEVPFHVDDGTGKVRVEPGDADLEIEVEKWVEVDDGDEPPDELGEWAREQGMVSQTGETETEGIVDAVTDAIGSLSVTGTEHLVQPSSRDRKFTETVLTDGESTYVFGEARRREDADFAENERNLVLREHEGTQRFIVSDKTERGLLHETIVETAVVLALALVLLPYGLLGMLAWIGIL